MTARTSSQKNGIPRELDPAARVLRNFRVVFNVVRQHFRSLESATGVSGSEIWALSHVAANPGMGVNQLARDMDVHQSTASNLLRGLLEAGLVKSEKTEHDRRSVHLHATARGMRLLARTPTPFAGILPAALRQLDERTLARMERDLGKLIDHLPRVDGAAAHAIIGEDK